MSQPTNKPVIGAIVDRDMSRALDPADALFLLRLAGLVEDISRLKAPVQPNGVWTEPALRAYILNAGRYLRKVMAILEQKWDGKPPTAAQQQREEPMLPKLDRLFDFHNFVTDDLRGARRFAPLLIYSGLVRTASYNFRVFFSK